MSYFRYPLKFTAITTYFSASHRALDFGWNNSYGGKNCPVYAIADAKVIEVGYNDETGYRIWLQTDEGNTRWLHRYIHLQKRPSFKVGQTVKKGAKVGNMGNTGNSYGNHLHFDLWKCPKGYTMNWSDRAKYAVNPTSYLYLHSGQVASSVAGNKKGVKKVPTISYTAGDYKTLYVRALKKGAGSTYASVKVKELTADGKKNATSKKANDKAYYKAGTVFTAKSITKNKFGNYWGKTPSGWVCLGNSKEVACKKI